MAVIVCIFALLFPCWFMFRGLRALYTEKKREKRNITTLNKEHEADTFIYAQHTYIMHWRNDQKWERGKENRDGHELILVWVLGLCGSVAGSVQ
ncbi:hypothetical protein QBC44DRAFT_330461 [Cladorrhinum sp. PSN332]|nr:hypothetical protein QBC44DRAFT_330461 [Cladorrhinum sp. PSN332]